MMRGRVGRYGRLVHLVGDWDAQTTRGTARCKMIYGEVRFTSDALDCPDCLVILAREG